MICLHKEFTMNEACKTGHCSGWVDEWSEWMWGRRTSVCTSVNSIHSVHLGYTIFIKIFSVFNNILTFAYYNIFPL